MALTEESPQKILPDVSADREQLLDKVDLLLEQYLDVLHQYQEARRNLASHFSSGFISLAQANFNSSGRRYGQDYYDQRMKASKIVSIDTSESDGTRLAIKTRDTKSSSKTKDNSKDELSEETPAGSSEATQPEAAPKEPQTESPGGSDEKMGSSSKGAADPIRWFGLFVPPSLKSSQQSFTTAVNETIPLLCNLQRDLKTLEIDIGRARKRVRKFDSTLGDAKV